MKFKTIREKLFWGMSGLILLFVILSQCLTVEFLEEYYVLENKKQLSNMYITINELYQGDPNTISLDLERLERTSGIHIAIYNAKLEPIYPLQRIPEATTAGQDANPLSAAVSPGPTTATPSPEMIQSYEKNLIQTYQKELKDGKTVSIVSIDQRIQTNFINLIKTLNNCDYLFLNTSVSSINKNVDIANRFFLFTGLLTLIIGSIAIFFFTKKMTLPILKLNYIAQKMAKLDFSHKYQVESNDEIGQLGESINSLSAQLDNAISKLTEANKKLLKDIEQERKIDKMRREFISSVSHELKTPISLIQGYAEGLRENVNEDEENKNFYCEIIMDEANKMGKLVMDLLDLSQIEAGTFKLDKTGFEISALISKIANKYYPVFQEKKITCHLKDKPELVVYADRFRTEQIIVNYLSNAINHIDQQRLITISIQSFPNKARVSVYNSGHPISPELTGKIWDSFYKVDKARTRAYGGTGLGLSIVRAIQEIDNNRYGVHNKDGGVEFWFELDVSLVPKEPEP